MAGGNWTLFTNDSGSAAGPTSYVQNVFQDVTLPANSNSGLTSNSNTNPFNISIQNTDAPRYGAKYLYISDVVLIQDRSKWIQEKPTYKIIFNEPYPNVFAYAFGNVQVTSNFGQIGFVLRSPTDGVGITSVSRKVAWMISSTTTSPALGQFVLDGVNTGTADFSGASSDSTNSGYNHFTPYVQESSNETLDLHDFRVVHTGVNLKINGFVVYTENSGANVDIPPGTTYVNKSEITTTVGASFTLPSYGASIGGKAVYYKSLSSGYAVSALGCSTVSSIAQGSSGTNILSVSAGSGASFPIGCGIVAAFGSTLYLGSVINVSTDTLTVSPTLIFGVSGPIYRAWTSSPTLAINASFMQLSTSIGFSSLSGFSSLLFDQFNRWAMWGSNLGFTTIDTQRCAYFLGASGFLQVDGYFSGAELETLGSTTAGFTITVNGLPAWSISSGQTGAVKRTIFSDAGPGWNSFNIAASASLAILGLLKIDLYQRSRDQGVSYGILGELETLQSYVPRSTISATTMALGTYSREYADQLYLKGTWSRGVTSGVAGGAYYIGFSGAASIQHQYYGKNFALVGTAASAATLTLDGTPLSNNFNSMFTVNTEGFHTLAYIVQGGTCLISAIDTTRTVNDIKILENVEGYTQSSYIYNPIIELRLSTQAGYASNFANFPYFSTVEISNLGDSLSYSNDSINGVCVTILKDGYYNVGGQLYSALSAASGVSITKNYAINNDSGTIPSANSICYSKVAAVSGGSHCPQACRTTFLMAGDQIRIVSDATGTPVVTNLCCFYITRVK